MTAAELWQESPAKTASPQGAPLSATRVITRVLTSAEHRIMGACTITGAHLTSLTAPDNPWPRRKTSLTRDSAWAVAGHLHTTAQANQLAQFIRFSAAHLREPARSPGPSISARCPPTPVCDPDSHPLPGQRTPGRNPLASQGGKGPSRLVGRRRVAGGVVASGAWIFTRDNLSLSDT